MIKPQRAQRTCQRMYSMILCSPSPGTSWPAGQGERQAAGRMGSRHQGPGAVQMSGRQCQQGSQPVHLSPLELHQCTPWRCKSKPNAALPVPTPPSPRVPLKMMVGFCQAGSSAIFLRMKKRMCAPSRAMNAATGQAGVHEWCRHEVGCKSWRESTQPGHKAAARCSHNGPQQPRCPAATHVCRG